MPPKCSRTRFAARPSRRISAWKTITRRSRASNSCARLSVNIYRARQTRADFMRVYGIQQDTGCPLPYHVRDKLREHDEQEVIPAHAGIQEPYRQSQAALEEKSRMRPGHLGL